MADLFGRRVVVTVGGLDLSSLRVVFRVERAHRAEPNSAEISVWNLSEDSRARIARFASGVPVTVVAGYREVEPFLVFAGTLRRVETRREGADLVTVVSSADGVPTSARFASSFAAGTGSDRVLTAVLDGVEALGVKVGAARALRGALSGRSVGAGGLHLRGGLDEALDAVLTAAGYEWSVQDGALSVTAVGAATARAVSLSADTGLVEDPQVLDRGRVRFRCLLVPGVVPPRLIELRSTVASGFYRVDTARIQADTAGLEWYVDAECSPV